LEEARTFIDKMPVHPDAIGWATLLSSCRFYGNMEIGKWAAERLVELEPQNPVSYVLLSSMYAAKGKWVNVAQLRRGMRAKGVRKEPGCSWIKYKNRVHIFSSDDQSSPFSDEIYVTPPKLASANPVESLAIYPDGPTCDQLGDHPCKIVRVSAREGE
jgi:hypothetical protein